MGQDRRLERTVQDVPRGQTDFEMWLAKLSAKRRGLASNKLKIDHGLTVQDRKINCRQ